LASLEPKNLTNSRPSPLQNRVTPDGRIEAVPARGLFTGNRGVLHRPDKRLNPALWRHKNWIICALQFKGRHRQLMTPNRWTELFFLDEAVALAAGHRPCAECRRQAYNAWMDAMSAGAGVPRPSAPDVDKRLHAERAIPGARAMQTHQAKLQDLPDGAFILEPGSGTPALVLGDNLLPWTHTGYRKPVHRGVGTVTTLTPPTSLAALRGGYAPLFHPSSA
jgi:hypothetical protein